MSKTPFTAEYRLFLTVAEQLNISKTAETLGLGQSGVSKAIRRLEEELGAKLLVRKNQGVELTREGKELKKALIKALAAWHESRHSSLEGGVFEGRFSLGGHRAVLAAHLPSRFPLLLQTYPGIHFDFVLGTSLETTRKVADLQLDFGIVINHVRTSDLIAKPLGRDYIACWGIAGTESKPLAYNPEMLDLGKTLKYFSHQQQIAIPDYQIIYDMVLAGTCRGLLPNTVVRDSKVKMIGKKLREVQVSLIYHAHKRDSLAYRAIVKALDRI